MEAAIREINQAPNIEHANEGNNIIPVLNIEILQPEAEVGSRRSKRQLPYINYNEDTTDESEIEQGAKALLEVLTLEHNPSKSYSPVSALLLEPYIPISFKDAMTCPEAEKWKEAIEDEYKSLMENKTWDVTALPQNRKAIKCKWILNFKPGHKGVDPRYKARLVACGYDQLYGVDYLATYSPVVKHYSIRLVLAIVAVFNLEMLQLDIKTAFLYGKLEETIFMRQPEGYVIPGREEEVCYLNKPIYGLKQSSNCWNKEFDGDITKFGFKRSQHDRCVYLRIRPDGEYTIVIIYVDDGLACSNRPKVFEAILEHLRKKFQVRTLPPNRFVGLDITRKREDRTLSINQPYFVRRILKRYNMEDCNQVSIPADPNNKVTAKMSPNTEEDKREMEKRPVREAIGSLM